MQRYRAFGRVGVAGMVASIGLALLVGQPANAAEKVGVSMPNIKGPWFTPVLYGISDEAKKLGYDVVIQDAGGYANVDKQVSQFSNLVVQKVVAILMDPANPASFNGVVKQANSAKIPVIGAGSPIVASDVDADAAASSSHCNVGHELAKGAKTLLPNGGTIAVLAGPPGAFWASDRLRCFKEDIAGTNLKIVAEQTSEQDPAIALSVANDFLQRFPKVDMLYGADDTYGVGAARAAQGAQKCGKVKVMFAVLGEAAEEMMRAGCADYVVAQQPVVIGRSAVRMMDALVKGKPLEKKKDEVPLIPVTMATLNSIDKSSMQAPKGWTP
ncbi:MAG: ribose transport system substrate-binding protein [Bradyrhizobium sp.]|jgi:ABC-type sugar transport system substrate-binding protein|nr:ribose transport system substrate-binding protein [Bradyrhizobium sp.]